VAAAPEWAAGAAALGSGTSAKAKLRRLTPAPGRLLSVPGFRGKQHIWCRGSSRAGAPTIIVVSGAGDFSLSWRQVQDRLVRRHRVCTYDRASLGWSGRSLQPRTGRHIVAELAALLDRAGIRGPLVVAAHSMGAVYARLFAAEHPRRVRGLALVDPGDEYLPVGIGRLARDALRKAVLAAARSQLVSARVCATGAYARRPGRLPLAAVLPHRDALTNRRLEAAWCRTWRGTAAEGLGANRTWAQARAKSLGPGSLRHRPVGIIVSADELTFVPDAALNRRIVAHWRGLQQQQRLISSRSRFRVAPRTSHLVMLDRPDLVAATVRWVVRQVEPVRPGR
jgi:pimeloyl-ACP methyl ester carboxylesterase